MLPAPVFTFTIPSIHDDTPLDCRIYHPIRFKNGDNSLSRWKKRGAVIAHPYAPLGGCYDDPVVLAAAAEILKAGFIVGTFNFRLNFSSTHLECFMLTSSQGCRFIQRQNQLDCKTRAGGLHLCRRMLHPLPSGA